MPLSMTGFARSEEQYSWGHLACEIRSVNHRYLDLSIKSPETLRNIEPQTRELIKKALHRGKVEINFYLRLDTQEGLDLALNETLVMEVAKLAQTSAKHLSNPALINPMDLLKWPGVIQSQELDNEELQANAIKIFKQSLEKLREARQREGLELVQFIEQRLTGIDKQVSATKISLPEILKHHQVKLEEKLQALRIDVDEDRLAQELVYLAQKSDVAEELDRLVAHLGEIRHTLKQKGPIGRRLDFLMQELNREANTLSSKSIATETTQSAVDLKVLIEQMREQIQNIE